MAKKVGWIDIPVPLLTKATWNYKPSDNDNCRTYMAEIRTMSSEVCATVRDVGNGVFELIDGNYKLESYVRLNIRAVRCYNLGFIPTDLAKVISTEMNGSVIQNQNLL